MCPPNSPDPIKRLWDVPVEVCSMEAQSRYPQDSKDPLPTPQCQTPQDCPQGSCVNAPNDSEPNPIHGRASTDQTCFADPIVYHVLVYLAKQISESDQNQINIRIEYY